jgi:ADP-heptose:LPS heptosyltransferase
LPDPFEERLMLEVLNDGCAVLLDKGSGGEEIERADRLVDRIRGQGWLVTDLTSASNSSILNMGTGKPRESGLVTWQGGIGAFSALVAESDGYIGYDSAGQHIAAALGVPTIDIFSRNASPIFRERWRPTGGSVVKVVSECAAGGTPRTLGDVLAEVLSFHREMLRK